MNLRRKELCIEICDCAIFLCIMDKLSFQILILRSLVGNPTGKMLRMALILRLRLLKLLIWHLSLIKNCLNMMQKICMKDNQKAIFTSLVWLFLKWYSAITIKSSTSKLFLIWSHKCLQPRFTTKTYLTFWWAAYSKKLKKESILKLYTAVLYKSREQNTMMKETSINCTYQNSLFVLLRIRHWILITNQFLKYKILFLSVRVYLLVVLKPTF